MNEEDRAHTICWNASLNDHRRSVAVWCSASAPQSGDGHEFDALVNPATVTTRVQHDAARELLGRQIVSQSDEVSSVRSAIRMM